MVFFTICARNYLALAYSLAASISALYPDSSFTIWLIDESIGDEISPVPGVRLRPIKAALPSEIWRQRTLRYNILELSTAVKASAFIKLFSEGARQIVYLDPDIFLFSRLYEVEDLLEKGAAGCVLPHMLTPLPKDEKYPDDLAILKSGVFNLGFLALRACSETDRFLEWWDGWLHTHCWADPSTGVFTDQRWMDFIPCLWPGILVCRHVGYDVAYWNLHERTLQHDGNSWRVNGEPLRFFHFSGFDPFNPEKLSKHQDRFHPMDVRNIPELLSFYGQHLLAYGHKDYRNIPLQQALVGNGFVCDTVVRHAFRLAENRNISFSFNNDGNNDPFFTWLTGLELGSRWPRYVHALLSLRPDVAASYSDYEDRHAEDLMRWIITDGIEQMRLSKDLLQHIGLLRGNGVLPGPIAVNYIGYLRSEMGVGEASRGYVKALRGAGVDVSLMDVSHLTIYDNSDNSLGIQGNPEDMPPASHRINLFHINADALPGVLDYLGKDVLDGRYNIGLWAWESEIFPESWHDRFAYLDEIWVGSSFMANAIAPYASCPVIVMPYVIEPHAALPDRQRWQIGESHTAFLFAFDYLSVGSRKNPQAVIAAFRDAFPTASNVCLVLKTLSAHHHPKAHNDLRELCAGDPRILVVDSTLARADFHVLVASCDAFVSLHRLEGYGLGIAEAMAERKIVIATAYGGNTDYMHSGNSFCIPYERVILEEDQGPYAKGTPWAEPDIKAAARAMRDIHGNQALKIGMGEAAQRDIKTWSGGEAVGKRMRARLGLINAKISGINGGAAIDSAVSTAAPYVPARRHFHVVRVLLRDILRRPRHYLSNARRAVKYHRRMGSTATYYRIVDELRRR